MDAAINWHSFFFLLFALVTCGFAVAVVVSSHIVHMAFYLIVSLGATAGLYFLAGADFVAALQLLIYVGGTLVLLIFGVMLTAQGPFISMKTRGGDWVVAAIVGGALLALLVATATGVPDWNSAALTAKAEAAAEAGQPLIPAERTASRIGLALLGARVDRLETDPAAAAGMAGYLLPFEIVSVHLLVVLIGAAYLARTRTRQRAAANKAA